MERRVSTLHFSMKASQVEQQDRSKRLMKATGIARVSRRKAARSTFRDERVRPACDLVDRSIYADAPDHALGR